MYLISYISVTEFSGSEERCSVYMFIISLKVVTRIIWIICKIPKIYFFVRFEVLTVLSIKICISLDMS
jgi:hypothetical protein